MSRAAPRSFSIALEELAARLAPRTTLADVQAVWERAAGAPIAAAARPTAERDGVLTISCAAGVCRAMDMSAAYWSAAADP